MTYPLEARLRPAYELSSAAVATACGIAVGVTPAMFLLPDEVAWVAAGLLLLLAAVRVVQGCQVIRYRRNLRLQRRYVVSSEQIPWSRDRLFVGRGFRWDQRHTQRLHEARLPLNQALLAPGIFARVLRRSAAALEDLSGDPSLHGVEPLESDVWIDIRDRVGHTLVLGTTRVGKTRLAELLIAQDIRRGEVVIVFDPKGDFDLLRRTYAEAKRAGRLGQFFMFHLGHPELSARYNPVGLMVLRKIGSSLAQLVLALPEPRTRPVR